MRNGYGTAAGCWDHQGCQGVGGISQEWFPRSGSHTVPWGSGCAAGTKAHGTSGLAAGGESHGSWSRHTAGLKWRPGLHPWHCLLLQTHRKACLGCSFQDGKEVVTHSQQYSEFFLPICMFEGTTGTNFYPTVTSSRNGVCACCVRGMGWCPVAAWKTLGISVLATEAPQHPMTWLSGSTARVMLLAMLPCQVLQQSGSADTAGAYCCLLISGCMQ